MPDQPQPPPVALAASVVRVDLGWPLLIAVEHILHRLALRVSSPRWTLSLSQAGAQRPYNPHTPTCLGCGCIYHCHHPKPQGDSSPVSDWLEPGFLTAVLWFCH